MDAASRSALPLRTAALLGGGLAVGVASGGRGLPVYPPAGAAPSEAAVTASRALPDAANQATLSVARPVFIPRLADMNCRGQIAIQNLSVEAQKVVVVGFAEGWRDCQSPAGIACTGLIAPGATWRVSSHELGDGAVSAVVFGLSARTRQELALSEPNDVRSEEHTSELRHR